MVRIFTLCAALMYVMTTCTFAHSAEVSTFRAGQAVAKHPDVKVYIDVLDQDGTPVDDIQQNQITATIGQIQAYVKDVKPFDKSGEGVGYVFLVDISRSISASQFEQMKSAINLWVNKMRDSDRAAIITFGEKVSTIQDYTADKNALNNGIKTLAISDNKTQLHYGIAKAIELGHRADANLPARRVIITLSDGEDDFPGGMTRDEVLAIMKADRIPIYAIGVSQKGRWGDANQKKLGEFARMSGGEFFDGNSDDWKKLYEAIQQKILKSFLVKLDATKIQADGKSYSLQLTLNSSGKTMTDNLDLRLLAQAAVTPAKEQPKPWYKKLPAWGYVASGGVLIVVIVLIVRARQKKAACRAAEAAEQEAARKKTADEAAAKAAAEKESLDELLTVKKAIPPGLNMKLSVLGSTGDQRDYGIILSSRAYIGRSSECDLSITDDEEISKRHCELVLEGGYVLISDLNSTNGTFVNGVPVKTGHRLKSGDLLMLGRTEMRIVF